MKSPARRAFTLVELLVVIAIIGILVSLLLPAVQAAREAGRRASCKNNLHQIGIAVQNYHDSLRMLPASGIVDTTSQTYDARSGTMFSWIVLILPYMEQQNLHSQFNFNVSVLQQSGNPQAIEIDTLQCPSDQARGSFFQHATFTNNLRFAKGNYAAFVSPYHMEEQADYPGALNSHNTQRMAHIQADGGTSNTLLASEVLTRDQLQDQRGAWALPWSGSTIVSVDLHPDHAGTGDGYLAETAQDTTWSQTPNRQGAILDVVYDCQDPASAQQLRMPCSTYDGWASAAPRSRHRGGVNAVFVDGHVGFMTDSIDHAVLAYLVSIEDGQVTNASNYVR